jgi:hypothetical protein
LSINLLNGAFENNASSLRVKDWAVMHVSFGIFRRLMTSTERGRNDRKSNVANLVFPNI